ncbi:MAG: NrfD/PsrC family molybdoenzyme membrane anchor subunit [bacterium]
MRRLIRIKQVLVVLAVFGLVALISRLIFGLGASTALSDANPWGIWKVVNMVAGAALGTGGFFMALLVYVFGVKRFKPLVRLAIVIAFLGYGSSCFALLFDIGIPYKIYSPFINWNVHSFLFEVAMCVTFYWLMTVLETIPIVTERTPFAWVGNLLHKFAAVIVIVGITLSSMHHTSLGDLFLTAPQRLHEIWFSPYIWGLFISSAVGSGMMLLTFVVLAFCYLYDRKPDTNLLGSIQKIAALILTIYGLFKAYDLNVRGVWPSVFSGQWEGDLFIVESFLLVIIPVIVVIIGPWRRTVAGLTIASVSAMTGLVLNRVDIGIIGFFRTSGQIYVPTLSEIFFCVGIVAAAALVLMFLIEYTHVIEEPPVLPKDAKGVGLPKFDPVANTWSGVAGSQLYSLTLTAVIAIVAAIALYSSSALKGVALAHNRVVAPTSADRTRTVLKINGNKNDFFVNFKHEFHKKNLSEEGCDENNENCYEDTCALCHHIDRPSDYDTACHKCHTDMRLPVSIFDHTFHMNKHGGNDGCEKCHTDPNRPRWKDNTKPCFECHEENMRMAKEYEKQFDYVAVGYVDAMHKLCVECHIKKGLELEKPLEECFTCHGEDKLTKAR